MAETKSDWPKMSDSLVIPALTIRIPMPRRVVEPRQGTQDETFLSIAASAETAAHADCE